MRKHLALILALLLAAHPAAAANFSLGYQGQLRQNGVPVTGTRSVVFQIYPSAASGTPVWTSPAQTITFTNGLFFSTFTPSGVDWEGTTPVLEVVVDGNPLAPREELSAMPYSFNAQHVSGKKYTTAATAPASPGGGDLWYDTSLSQLKFWNGLAWVTFAGGVTTIVSDSNQFSGDGSAASPLTLRSSSVTLQGNTFNAANTLVKLDASGRLPAVDATQVTGVVLKTGDTMTGQLTMTGAGASIVTGASVTASAFFGDGSGLTNVAGTDSNRVSKSGDFMTGQLTTESTITVKGGEFSVGGSTLTVAGGRVTAAEFQVGASSFNAAGLLSLGQPLHLDNTTSNLIQFNSSGLGLPTLGTRSAGTKIVLHPSLTGGTADYGLGVASGAQWYSLPTGPAHSHRFYAGTAELMRIAGEGRVGINNPAPAARLDVGGDAQFGSGATKSTFTTTGALQLARDAGLTLSGSGGAIISGSSVTASAFFGDGTNLTGVTASNVAAADVLPGVLGPNVIASSVAVSAIGDDQISSLSQSKVTNLTSDLGARLLKAGDTMTGQLTMSGASSYIVSGTSIVASAFFGDGSNLTGLDLGSRVAKTGDTMTGQLTVISSVTVQGNSGADLELLKLHNANVGGNGNGASILWSFGSGTNQNARISVTRSGTSDPSGEMSLYTANTGGTPRLGLFLDREGMARIGSPDVNPLTVQQRPKLFVDRQSGVHGAGPAAAFTGGEVGVGTARPSTTLDVDGNAQFGSGAVKSTFTTSGALQLARNAGLTLSGATGNIVTGASVTASAFFGDGSNLTGIDLNSRVAKTGDVMTGALTIAGSSLAIRAAAGDAYSVLVSSQNGADIFRLDKTGMLVLGKAGGTSLGLGSENYGLGWNGAGNMNFFTDGASRMNIDQTGHISIPGNVTTGPKFGVTDTDGAGLVFRASTSTTLGSAALAVDNTNRVGVNTTSPGATLHVAGDAYVASALTVSSGTFTAAGDSQFSLRASSGVTVGQGVYANFFVGDGRGLTNVAGSDSSKVSKTGDMMSGQLTVAQSSITITGPQANGVDELLRLTKIGYGGSIFKQYYDPSTAYGLQIVGTDGRAALVTDTSVNPARVGIGGVLLPKTVLDVGGDAQFGSGANKSTFTTTGALQLARNAGLTLSGASGNIVTGASVTASAFFGDGSNLTGIDLGSRVAKTGDVMTGALTIAGSSLSIRAAASDEYSLYVSSQNGTNILRVDKAGTIISGKVGGASFGLGSSSDGLGWNGTNMNLLVNGGARMTLDDTGHVSIPGSIAAGPKLGVTDTDGSGLVFRASTSSLLATAGLAVDSSNRVGVGTSAPAERLDVDGNVRASGGVRASSGTFTATGNAQYALETSSGIKVNAGGVEAPFFIGDGRGLTNVSGADVSRVAKAGDTMTGQLTLAGGSSMTVTGPMLLGSGPFELRSSAGEMQFGLNLFELDSDDLANYQARQDWLVSPTQAYVDWRMRVPGDSGTAASRFFFDLKEGRLGVGTTSPATKLHMSSGTLLIDGTGPAIRMTNGGAVQIVNTVGTSQEVLSLDSSNTVNLGNSGGLSDVRTAANVNMKVGTGAPATKLDVEGNAQFGAGAAKSTFTTTGALQLARNAGLTLSGASGNIVTGASVTASAFFGNGAGLTNVSGTDATKVAKTGDTMTGALTMSGALANIVSGSSVTTSGGLFGSSLRLGGGSRAFTMRESDDGNDAGYLESNTTRGLFVLHSAGVENVQITGGAENVFFAGGGNLGVNTKNPAGKLHVSSGPVIFDGTGAGMFLGANNQNVEFTMGGSPTNNSTSRLKFLTSNLVRNWQISTNDTVAGALEFMPSTVAGGNSFTTPTLAMLGANVNVPAGSLGLGTYAPATKLDVNGDAQFGSGATKSTFTASGALQLASGAGLTMTSGGITVNSSSVTVNDNAGSGVFLARGQNGGFFKSMLNADSNSYNFFGHLGAIVGAYAGQYEATILSPAGWSHVDGNTNLRRFKVYNDGTVTFNSDSATASTMTAAGSLTLARNGSVTLSGATGNITTQSSVTASAFFGSGAGLTNVTAAQATSLASDPADAPSGKLARGINAAGVAEYAHVDTTAVSASTNPITSGGVFTALAGKQNADADLDDLADGSLTASKVAAGYDASGLVGAVPVVSVNLSTVTTALAGKQNADADLDDLADGSLTASKVAAGYDASGLVGAVPAVSVNLSTVTTALAGKQNADADLDDLADGSLTASKVAAGYDASGLIGAVPQVSVNLSTVTTALAGKVNDTGDTITGVLNLNAAGADLDTTTQDGITIDTHVYVTNGSLGIGTTAPSAAAKLQVSDGSAVTNFGAGQIALTGTGNQLLSINSITSGGVGVMLHNNGANAFRISADRSANRLDIANDNGAPWAGTNLVSIQLAGNMGVGTVSPQTKLDVEGSAQFGAGAAKSTFTAAGGLALAAAANITLANNTGVIGRNSVSSPGNLIKRASNDETIVGEATFNNALRVQSGGPIYLEGTGVNFTAGLIADGTIFGQDIANSTITLNKLNASGCATNQVPQFDGTNWVCASIGAAASGWTDDSGNNKTYVTTTGRQVAIGTITPASGAKLTVAGELNMQANKIVSVASPTASGDAVNKGYLDVALRNSGLYGSGANGHDCPSSGSIGAGTYEYENCNITGTLTLTGSPVVIKVRNTFQISGTINGNAAHLGVGTGGAGGGGGGGGGRSTTSGGCAGGGGANGGTGNQAQDWFAAHATVAGGALGGGGGAPGVGGTGGTAAASNSTTAVESFLNVSKVSGGSQGASGGAGHAGGGGGGGAAGGAGLTILAPNVTFNSGATITLNGGTGGTGGNGSVQSCWNNWNTAGGGGGGGGGGGTLYVYAESLNGLVNLSFAANGGSGGGAGSGATSWGGTASNGGPGGSGGKGWFVYQAPPGNTVVQW